MSSNDYVDFLEKKNPKLFRDGVKTIKLPLASFKLQIKKAFEAGEVAGKTSKSVFEQVFG